MEQKLYAECARMGEKIPYWTVGGVYEEDYAKKDIYWWTNGFWSGILSVSYTHLDVYKRQGLFFIKMVFF